MKFKRLAVLATSGVAVSLALTATCFRLCLAAAVRPCTTQFASMLACWSATGDVMSTGACAESAKLLLTCMRTAVSTAFTVGLK